MLDLISITLVLTMQQPPAQSVLFVRLTLFTFLFPLKLHEKKGQNVLIIGISASDTLLEMIGLLMKPVFAVSWETSELIPHSRRKVVASVSYHSRGFQGQTWAASQPLFAHRTTPNTWFLPPKSGCPH